MNKKFCFSLDHSNSLQYEWRSVLIHQYFKSLSRSMNLDIYLKFKRIDHGGCNHNVHNASKMCKPSLSIIIYTDLSNNSDDILGDWTLLQNCAGGPHPNYSRFYHIYMRCISSILALLQEKLWHARNRFTTRHDFKSR